MNNFATGLVVCDNLKSLSGWLVASLLITWRRTCSKITFQNSSPLAPCPRRNGKWLNDSSRNEVQRRQKADIAFSRPLGLETYVGDLEADGTDQVPDEQHNPGEDNDNDVEIYLQIPWDGLINHFILNAPYDCSLSILEHREKLVDIRTRST